MTCKVSSRTLNSTLFICLSIVYRNVSVKVVDVLWLGLRLRVRLWPVAGVKVKVSSWSVIGLELGDDVMSCHLTLLYVQNAIVIKELYSFCCCTGVTN